MAKKKDVSFAAIIVAVLWAAALTLCRAFVPVILPARQIGIGETEILSSAAFFVAAFSPVYRSIWLDKKLGITKEKTGEEVNV